MNVQAMETGRQDAGSNRLHGDGDVAVGEVEGRRGHLPTVRVLAVARSGNPRRAPGWIVVDDPAEPLRTGGVVPGCVLAC